MLKNTSMSREILQSLENKRSTIVLVLLRSEYRRTSLGPGYGWVFTPWKSRVMGQNEGRRRPIVTKTEVLGRPGVTVGT